MKRPLFFLALVLSAGIFTASLIPFKIAFALWILGLALLTAFPLTHQKVWARFVLILLVFLLGVFLYGFKIYFPPSQRVDQLCLSQNSVEMRGLVVDFVQISGVKQAVVKVTQIKTEKGEWQSSCGKIILKGQEGHALIFRRFQEIEVSADILQRPFEDFQHEGGFSVWLRSQGIVMGVQALRPDSIRVIRNGGNRFERFLEKIKAAADQNLLKGFSKDSPVAPLLQAMVLGTREDVSADLKSSFLYTNTIHILSISGLHLTVILIAILFVLGLFSLPARWVYACALVTIWIYALMTGLSPPLVRSAFMASFFIVGRILRKRSDLANALGGAGLAMLLFNPLSLFDPGFQLSFLCLMSLIFLTPLFEKDLASFQKVPSKFIPLLLQRREKIWAKGVQGLLKTLSGSLAVWVGVLPLIAYHFRIFSPITVLANLVAVPLVGIIMNIGFASSLLGFFSFLVIPLNIVNEILLKFLVISMDVFSKIPGAYFYVEKPTWLWFLVYAGIILLGFFLATRKIKPCYFFLCALSFVSVLIPSGKGSTLKLSFLSRENIKIQMADWPSGERSLWIEGLQPFSKRKPWLDQLSFLLGVSHVDQIFTVENPSDSPSWLIKMFGRASINGTLPSLNNGEVQVSQTRKLEYIQYGKIWLRWIDANNFYNLKLEKIDGEGFLILLGAVDQEKFLKWIDHQNVMGILALDAVPDPLQLQIKARHIPLFRGEGYHPLTLGSDGKSIWLIRNSGS